MKRIICFLLLLLFSLSLFSQILVTTAEVNLRSDPNTECNIICKVSKGSLVSIIEELEGWTKIVFNKQTGYVNNNYVKLFNGSNSSSKSSNSYNYSLTSESKSTNVKYYTNSKGEKVQSPTYYSKPPSGATAECRDGTYSFSKNRRGTCSHHGGVKRWLQ